MGTFGSKPIGSALAVADGTVTSVLEIAARMSVLRTFFKFLPFAVRAPKQAHGGGLQMFGGGDWVLWDVPSLFGTAAAGWFCPAGHWPPAAARLCRPQPRSHAGPWIHFSITFRQPVSGSPGTVRNENAFVIFGNWTSPLITSRSRRDADFISAGQSPISGRCPRIAITTRS